MINKKNIEIQNRQKSNNLSNGLNSSKGNQMDENTIILKLKIKLDKNVYKTFLLKRYDNVFLKLEKFLKINNISQDFIRPFVTEISIALDKIFSIINYKIGNYDQKYLNSLYNLWIKNDKEININKSSTNSSNSQNEKSYKYLKSNSFQNIDENKREEKINLGNKHTSKSF